MNVDTQGAGILITDISLEDVERLENIFATRTQTGWIVPQWLNVLRAAVEQKEKP